MWPWMGAVVLYADSNLTFFALVLAKESDSSVEIYCYRTQVAKAR